MRRAWILLTAAALAQVLPASTWAPQAWAESPADKPSGVPEPLVQTAVASFVKVHYHFKKDVTEEAGQKSWAAWRARLYERFVDDKITLDAVGIAVAPDTVWVYDNGLEDRFIDRIEVVTSAGQTLAARREKLLVTAPIETLKVTGKGLKPLKFAKAPKVTLKTSLWSAGLIREGDRWRLTCAALSPSTVFDRTWGDNLVFAAAGERPKVGHYDIADTSTMNALQLLANQAGEPVGVAGADLFDAKGALCAWRGTDLLKAPALSRAQLVNRRDGLRADLRKSVHEIKVKFQQEARKTSDLGSYAGREISVYGMAVSPKQAIVPRLFSRKHAAKIESIQVKYDDGRRAKCRFLGVYKDFGATLIELTAETFPGHAALAKADPARMGPLWAAAPRQKDGKTDVDLTLNRLLKKSRGYRNHFHWVPAIGLPVGTFVMTMDGKLAGVQMQQRVEDEEQRQLAQANDRLSQFRTAGRVRLFTVGEIRPALADADAAFDPKIKVLSKRLAKRRHWLGVEFAGMNRDLAEQMKIEKQTKDGTIGFLVSAVYAGSPAEKMGIAVGDILLSLRVEGQPYPVELKSSYVRPSTGGAGSDSPSGPARRIWKNRANFLTKVLDAIGADKTAAVTYFDAGAGDPDKGAGKTLTKTFTVERAPEDFDSAMRWKNRTIGLTVKDLTYEVRKALSLASSAPGTVVARIEPGSPANIARIWTNEIITRCDGRPVAGAQALRDAVAAAAKAGKDKVRLTVLRLGKTRFADLTVTAYDANDDEGLDEQ